MFTQENKKELRTTFWRQFKHYSNKQKLKVGKPGKWIMNDTGIKQLHLKFDVDEDKALAGIEIETRNLDKRIELFDKLETLKSELISAVPSELSWDLEYQKSQNKTVSYIYAKKTNVNIYEKTCWKQVFKFLYDVMSPIEDIFIKYKDYLK